MTDAVATDEADLHQAAWKRWWDRDFSWEGLANPNASFDPAKICWNGPDNPETRLSDYWRRDPDSGCLRSDEELLDLWELEKCDGVLFHIVHLPPAGKDGTPTWKANLYHDRWDALETLVAARLTEATSGSKAVPAEPWRIAELGGAVLRSMPQPEAADTQAIRAKLASAMIIGRSYYHSISIHRLEMPAATFLGGITLDYTAIGYANLCDCWFIGYVSSELTQFYGRVSFDRARFNRSVDFSFSDFLIAVTFTECLFASSADFSGTEFHSDADFSKSKFLDSVSFERSKICNLSLQNVGFSSFVKFNNAVVHGSLNTFATVFDKLTDFSAVIWPWRTGDEVSFDKARFAEPVVFTGGQVPGGDRFLPLAAFDGAILEAGVSLDTREDSEADRLFGIQLARARPIRTDGRAPFLKRARLVLRIAAPKGIREPARRRLARAASRKQRATWLGDTQFARLERGCRVLKQQMEKSANKLAEQQFHRFELISRRSQRSTPFVERIFSHLYGLTCNYGASLGRPIGALVVLWAVFSLFFWLLGHGADGSALAALRPGSAPDPVLIDAMSLSAARVLPTGAFDYVARNWFDAFACSNPAWLVFMVRVLASLESILAVVLAFMFGFAVRRKFQIG